MPGLAVVMAVVAAAHAHADESESIASLVSLARRSGLRVLAGDHLTLVTDRPARAGDGVEDLPAVFDAGWSAWCDHYGLDAQEHHGWRAFGCLIIDRERFRRAGLLPDAISDFANGHCHADRFWLADQSNPDYRRHLLLHEGVHAFTLTLRGLDTPTWYTEGIAEYLATHRLDASAGGRGGFVPTPIPLRSGDVEQLGRIERIRAMRAGGECPGLSDVFAAAGADHRDLSAYASSWAAVAMLAQHPHHARVFAAAERGPLDAHFTRRLQESPGWNAPQADRDFDAFTDEVDYGYDLSRSAIDWSPGRPLDMERSIAVEGDRGWQHSGWSLTRGRGYICKAAGRCVIGVVPDATGTAARGQRQLESTADGISLRWYRGRPLGKLLVAQWVEETPERGRPRFVVLAEGTQGRFTAATDGPLYCKINEPPGELADNEGRLDVVVTPAE